ncbi:MAG: hypothetical protein AB8C46_15375 [Burkholderiaceae bacterium]
MNTKFAIALFAAAAFSTSAIAGELYGAVERQINAAPIAATSATPFETSVAVSGALYPEAYAAIDNAVASAEPREAYVTTLAVGGELGSPSGSDIYGSPITQGAFAE